MGTSAEESISPSERSTDLKANLNTTLLTSEDTVRNQLTLVENPKIKQNRDFNDYTQFIQGKNVVTINAQGRAGWTTHE